LTFSSCNRRAQVAIAKAIQTEQRRVEKVMASCDAQCVAYIKAVSAPPSLGNHPFLVCTRAHESDSAGGYRAISPGGTYRGAYQFLQSTWNSVARRHRAYLVGVDPAGAAPHDQDFLAYRLMLEAGAQPWGNRCAWLVRP
jgi:muramidase (phage lysozyme)